MVPAPSVRPDVLPTERLTASGMPVPAIRDELRRIPNVRNAFNVASVWLQTAGLLLAVCWITERVPLAVAVPIWAATFVLMGRGVALFAILGHEAAHRLLFSRKRLNDFVGQWLLTYPVFVPFHAYRRVHFAHHKDEMGPNEPDLNLYQGYPITRDSMMRKLRRDISGSTGWKNLKGLFRAFRSADARPVAIKIVATQLVLWAGLWLVSGRWWLYPVFWFAPFMTVWRVLNRLRAIAEHGGMTRSKDRRETTHLVRQSWIARFWFVPFNTGWHLAHHVDMGVPFQNLPRLQRELQEAGWITLELEYPSYLALWSALSSRPQPASSSGPVSESVGARR
jgi:fatty acid desaturase